MVGFASIPVVGKTKTGKPANMIYKTDNNRSVMTTNAASIRRTATSGSPLTEKSNPTWKTLKVNAIHSNGTSVVAIGTGVDSTGTSKNIAWNNISGQWVIGLSPISGLRNIGIDKKGSLYLIADNVQNKVFSTKFDYPQGGLAGSFNNKLPKVEIVNKGSVVDAINNNGTITVQSSLNSVGTWVNTGSITDQGSWKQEVGQVEYVLTKHKSTSYTFPGSTATNIQRVFAVANGENHPVYWNQTEDKSKGYYGLIGGDQGVTHTNTWTK